MEIREVKSRDCRVEKPPHWLIRQVVCHSRRVRCADVSSSSPRLTDERVRTADPTLTYRMQHLEYWGIVLDMGAPVSEEAGPVRGDWTNQCSSRGISMPSARQVSIGRIMILIAVV